MTWIFFLNQHPGSCSFFQLLNCFAVCTLQLIRAETSIQYSSQIRAIVYNDHEKIILLFILFLGLFIYITQNEMNILGLTRQHKIAWKSGRKFILKFSPQADFNFVQPWPPASPLFTQPFIRGQINENIKAPRHWPLWGEFTKDRWIPRTNGPVTPKMLPFDGVTIRYLATVSYKI